MQIRLWRPARPGRCTWNPTGGMRFPQDRHGVLGKFPVYSARAFVRGVELGNYYSKKDKSVAHFMRVTK